MIQVRCERCNTTDTRFRQRTQSHVCRRCGHIWTDKPQPPEAGSLVSEGLIKIRSYARIPNVVAEHFRRKPVPAPVPEQIPAAEPAITR